MEDVYGLKMLLYMIFRKQKFLSAESMNALNASIPACLLEQDFRDRMDSVLFVRRRIVSYRWRNFFHTCFQQLLSSHERYLTFVMFACLVEHQYHQIIFESLISVCAVIKLFCDEMLLNTGVDFSDLNPHIFMEFYQSELEKVFIRRGGFRRLVDYIRDHRYHKWKLNMEFSISPGDPTPLDLMDKIEKELRREGTFEMEINPYQIARDATSQCMAKKVLSYSLVKLPALPKGLDLTRIVVKYKKKLAEYTGEKRTDAAEKLEVVDEDLHLCSSSNSSFQTRGVAKYQDNIEWHENIIQAVVRHNHLKSAIHENANNRIQGKAEVLDHLKDKIKSLIKVLDDYGKE